MHFLAQVSVLGTTRTHTITHHIVTRVLGSQIECSQGWLQSQHVHINFFLIDFKILAMYFFSIVLIKKYSSIARAM